MSKRRRRIGKAVGPRLVVACVCGVALLAVPAAVGEVAGGAGPRGVIVLSCSGCPGDRTGALLYTLRPSGGRLRPLPGTAGASYPSWSPDARFVAYSVLRFGKGGQSSQIWRRTADGSRARRLTSPAVGVEDSEPTWSPDGRTIAFTRLDAQGLDQVSRTSFWRLPAAGGPARQLLPSRGTNIVYPAWSPDGRRIAYSDVGERLWVVRADGSGRTRFGPAALRGRAPRWSPDGNRVAFFRFGATEGLTVLDLRTGRLRTLTTAGGDGVLPENDFAWSPDGAWIAMAHSRPDPREDYEPGCEAFEVLLVRVRDGHTRVIATGGDCWGGETMGLDWRGG